MGRPLTYRNGPVRLWSGDVHSDQNSQQIADPYTFTHVEHGALFYGLTWVVMRGASLGTRAVAAIAIEAAWETYENTDAVIERYRTETISLGYYGDSIVNSLADIAACLIGFLLAWRLPRRVTVSWIIIVEVILALWIRDNLFLNILMLVRPLDAVRQWQMGAIVLTRGARAVSETFVTDKRQPQSREDTKRRIESSCHRVFVVAFSLRSSRNRSKACTTA